MAFAAPAPGDSFSPAASGVFQPPRLPARLAVPGQSWKMMFNVSAGEGVINLSGGMEALVVFVATALLSSREAREKMRTPQELGQLFICFIE